MKNWVFLLAPAAFLLFFVAPLNAEDSSASRYRAGLAYERLGRLEDAYRELQLGCVLEPDDVPMSLALGVIALRLGRYDVAQRTLEHTISVDANSIASYYELALLYEKQNSVERAVDSWHRFMDLNQDDFLKVQAQRHLRVLESNKP